MLIVAEDQLFVCCYLPLSYFHFVLLYLVLFWRVFTYLEFTTLSQANSNFKYGSSTSIITELSYPWTFSFSKLYLFFSKPSFSLFQVRIFLFQTSFVFRNSLLFSYDLPTLSFTLISQFCFSKLPFLNIHFSPLNFNCYFLNFNFFFDFPKLYLFMIFLNLFKLFSFPLLTFP